MANGMDDRRKSLEEEYFHRKNKEAIEKLRGSTDKISGQAADKARELVGQGLERGGVGGGDENLHRGAVPRRRMRALGVVVVGPSFDLLAGMVSGEQSWAGDAGFFDEQAGPIDATFPGVGTSLPLHRENGSDLAATAVRQYTLQVSLEIRPA